jgi:hypothetical protein
VRNDTLVTEFIEVILYSVGRLSKLRQTSDKWPLELELARLCGWATSDHGVRRGRKSFNGHRQIAQKIID